MRPERTVQQHPVVQHRTLILEIGQPHPAILAQRFGIIGLRQGEQGQLILPDLCVMDLGADGVRVLRGNSPLHFQQVLRSLWKTALTSSDSVRSASCPAPDSSAPSWWGRSGWWCADRP